MISLAINYNYDANNKTTTTTTAQKTCKMICEIGKIVEMKGGGEEKPMNDIKNVISSDYCFEYLFLGSLRIFDPRKAMYGQNGKESWDFLSSQQKKIYPFTAER